MHKKYRAGKGNLRVGFFIPQKKLDVAFFSPVGVAAAPGYDGHVKLLIGCFKSNPIISNFRA
jgi:hypothetical protein